MGLLSPRPLQKHFTALWNWRHGIGRRVANFVRLTPITRTQQELDAIADEALADGDETVCRRALIITHERLAADQAEESRLQELQGSGHAAQTEEAASTSAEASGSPKKRPCYDRDHTFLRWKTEEGMTRAKIRDRWNEEHPEDNIGGGRSGIDIVKTGLKKAEKEAGDT